MAAPNDSIAPSKRVAYLSTPGAYDIETTLGAPSREVVVVVAGTLNTTDIGGNASGVGIVLAGTVLTGQFTDVTLAGGAEIWILL